MTAISMSDIFNNVEQRCKKCKWKETMCAKVLFSVTDAMKAEGYPYIEIHRAYEDLYARLRTLNAEFVEIHGVEATNKTMWFPVAAILSQKTINSGSEYRRERAKVRQALLAYWRENLDTEDLV